MDHKWTNSFSTSSAKKGNKKILCWCIRIVHYFCQCSPALLCSMCRPAARTSAYTVALRGGLSMQPCHRHDDRAGCLQDLLMEVHLTAPTHTFLQHPNSEFRLHTHGTIHCHVFSRSWTALTSQHLWVCSICRAIPQRLLMSFELSWNHCLFCRKCQHNVQV